MQKLCEQLLEEREQLSPVCAPKHGRKAADVSASEGPQQFGVWQRREVWVHIWPSGE